MGKKILLSLVAFSSLLYGIDRSDPRVHIYTLDNYTSAVGRPVMDIVLRNLIDKLYTDKVESEFNFNKDSSFSLTDYEKIKNNISLIPVSSLITGHNEVYYPLIIGSNKLEYIKLDNLAFNQAKVNFTDANIDASAYDKFDFIVDGKSRSSIEAKEINITNSTLSNFMFENMYMKYLSDAQGDLIASPFGDYTSGSVNIKNSTLNNVAIATGTLNVDNSSIQANGVWANELNSNNTTYIFDANSNNHQSIFVRARASGGNNTILIKNPYNLTMNSYAVIQDTDKKLQENYFTIKEETALSDKSPATVFFRSPSDKAIWLVFSDENKLKEEFPDLTTADIDIDTMDNFFITCVNGQQNGCKYENGNYIYTDEHPYYNMFKENGIINEEGIFRGDIHDVHIKPAKSVLSNEALKQSRGILNQAKFSWAFEVNNLTKRLGEIRDLQGEQGAWARTFIGAGSFKDNDQKVNYYAIQLGADKWLNNDKSLLGLSAGYTRQNLKDAITGNQTSYSLGAYFTHFVDERLYFDAVLRYIHTSGDYEYARFGKLSSNNLNIFLGSIEAGYKMPLNNQFYIEPQAELIISRIPKSVVTSDKVSFEMKAQTPISSKLALYTGMKANDKLIFRAGIGGYFDLNDQDTKITLKEKGATYNDSIKKDKRAFANIFAAYQINKNNRINLEVERTFGGDFNIDYNFNINYRYTF